MAHIKPKYRPTEGDRNRSAVKLWQSIRNGEMTEDQLIHTVTESIFANLDVMTSVITGCILHIAENKRIQKKLQQEIDNHKDTLADYVKRQDTFMHWCFLESIRLEPIPGEICPSPIFAPLL